MAFAFLKCLGHDYSTAFAAQLRFAKQPVTEALSPRCSPSCPKGERDFHLSFGASEQNSLKLAILRFLYLL